MRGTLENRIQMQSRKEFLSFVLTCASSLIVARAEAPSTWRKRLAVLKLSSETVLRDWKMAKNWLRCELSGESLDGA